MFCVAILVILLGISWVAGTKVLRNQAETKTKAEIKMLMSACRQYKDMYIYYPIDEGTESDVNFLQWLSPVKYDNQHLYDGQIPMFIDYDKNNINYEGNEIKDPYEQTYQCKLENGVFSIWSVGLDGQNKTEDDVSSVDY